MNTSHLISISDNENNKNVDLKVDVLNALTKLTIPVSILESVKFHSQMGKVKKLFKIEDSTEELIEGPPVVFQNMNHDKRNESH